MQLQVEISSKQMNFETTGTLFSPAHADRGTLAMLSTAPFTPGLRVLDLGCGWGLVGVYAALFCGAENVVMTDIDPKAAKLAQMNAQANGVPEVRVYTGDALDAVPNPTFDLILSNPPYQTDFAVAKKLIMKSFNRLEIGGRLVMVTKRRDWYKNKLIGVFGGVHIQEIDGYYVFNAERRGRNYAQK